MKELRLARKMLKTLVKDRVQYPESLIVDTIALITRCGVLLILYWYVFKLKGEQVFGIPFTVVAWSIFFYFSFSVLRLREISRAIMQDIQSGNVEVLFSKPISYLSYRIWWQIGSGLYPFLVIGALGVAALVAIVGIAPTMLVALWLPTFLLALLGGAMLSLCLYSIVGLLAFWIEDINPVFWMVDKTVMILGGSYLPVALFPPLMYQLARYSPFGASQFVTHTVYGTWQVDWPQLIGVQVVWILVLGAILFLIFDKAKRKVSVNGG